MTQPRAYPRTCLLLVSLAFAATPGTLSGQAQRTTPELRDGSRDFDFEFGDWTATIRRLVRPLTGDTTWALYTGTSVVYPLWGGKSNIGELDVSGPAGQIRGLSLRLYDPAAGQWHIRWASSRDGALGPPMIGGFDEAGYGEFYNQELLDGRAIYVRFIFTGTREATFRIEQAFSDDGGESWETNWIAEFERAGS